jgi:hypothetical protein
LANDPVGTAHDQDANALFFVNLPIKMTFHRKVISATVMPIN